MKTPIWKHFHSEMGDYRDWVAL